MVSKSQNSSFITQAAILAGAGLFVRLIGFFYRLPMTNMMGDEGMGIYGQGYNVYNFLLVLSSAGLPAAISRMVSARLALKQNKNAHKVFKVSMVFSVIVGSIGSLVLFFGAKFFAELWYSPDAYYCMLTLAPTLLITAVMSVFRGYFQGMNNAVPTAISQVAEQIVNAIASIWLVYIFYQESLIYAAAGGTAATGIGALCGLLVIMGIYAMAKSRIKRNIHVNVKYTTYESNSSIAKELVATAFPIIAGTAIFSLTNLIDNSMVMARLTHNDVFSYNEALRLFGQLNSKFVVITTLPVSISSSMGTAAIPGISAAMATNNLKNVSEKINLAVRLVMVICIPAAFGIGVFGEPILILLFPSASEGGLLLQVGFISVVFLALSQICTGVLQGIGQVKIPVFSALAGCIAKIIVNYFLLAIPSLNILGAVIGTIICYAVAAPINMFFAYRYARAKPDFIGIFARPLGCAVIMAGVCYVAYNTIYYIYPSNTIALLLGIVIGVSVYFMLMIMVGGIIRSDFLAMPMGNKLIRMAERLGFEIN